MVSELNNILQPNKMRKKILVVEDDSDVLNLLTLVLRGAGYSVATASDGRTALKKLPSLKPDLVVLDLLLPGMDGFAVCETMRGCSESSHLSVLMLTGLSSQFARLAGFEAGANDYLTKPFTPEELLERVHSLFSAGPASGSHPGHRGIRACQG